MSRPDFRFLFTSLLIIFTGSVNAQQSCTTKEVRTSVIIQSPPDSVWKMLTAFDRFPEWNPFIKSVNGLPHKGKMMRFTITNADGSVKKFKARILACKTNESLAWGGSMLFFFKARHYFLLEPNANNSTILIQGEYWHGLFGKAYGKKVYESACINFEKMNAVMKAELEKD